MGTIRAWKYGGMSKGYKFQLCPKCNKRGVSAKVSRSSIGKVTAHRTCKYCGWFEASQH